MRVRTVLASAFALALAACGGDARDDTVVQAEEEPDAFPDQRAEDRGEVAADAALAARAAEAEAADAAIGGNLNAAEVSAAPGVTVNGQ